MRKTIYSLGVCVVVLIFVSYAVAAGGVKINGDITLAKDTLDPLRVLYYSNGTSQSTASPWSLNNTDLFYLGGNVGIGKVPSSPLDVNGDIKISGNLLLTSPSTIMLDSSPLISLSLANNSFSIGSGKSAQGAYNTVVGANAYQNSGGVSNTAIGSYSMQSNGSGNSNTAVGQASLQDNNDGSNNTAIGWAALTRNISGNSNTAVGTSALFFNTSGTENTATGEAALMLNTLGSSNTAVGYRTLWTNTNAVGNTAVGSGALQSQNFGNSGTPWITYNTAVGSLALNANNPTTITNGIYNAAFGASALSGNTVGAGNAAVGYSAGVSNVSGNNNTFLGVNSDITDGTFNNATAIGSNAKVNASNKVRIGDNTITVIEGQVAWSNPSDIRLKKDVIDVTYGLDFINKLHPVEFRMKDGNGKVDFGFIAQSIEALIGTDYNILGIGSDSERTLTLRYTDFIAPMVKAIQEQSKVISEQEQRIKTLEYRLRLVESLLNSK